MAGCRDCHRCLEIAPKTLIMIIPRLIYWIVPGFFGVFIKKCPQCNHRMANHKTLADGRLAD